MFSAKPGVASSAAPTFVSGPNANTVTGSDESRIVEVKSATASSATGLPPFGKPSPSTASNVVRHSAGGALSPISGFSAPQLTGTSPYSVNASKPSADATPASQSA